MGVLLMSYGCFTDILRVSHRCLTDVVRVSYGYHTGV